MAFPQASRVSKTNPSWNRKESSQVPPIRVSAGVKCDEGVTVSKMVVCGIDNGPGSFTVHLRRRFAFTADWDEMSAVTTDGVQSTIAAWLDETIAHPVVQNGLYSYDLWVNCLAPDRKLRSVFIHYDH